MLEIRTRKKFLAVGEIYMAIFRPNSGFQRRTFVSSGSSAEAFWGGWWRKRTKNSTEI